MILDELRSQLRAAARPFATWVWEQRARQPMHDVDVEALLDRFVDETMGDVEDAVMRERGSSRG